MNLPSRLRQPKGLVCGLRLENYDTARSYGSPGAGFSLLASPGRVNSVLLACLLIVIIAGPRVPTAEATDSRASDLQSPVRLWGGERGDRDSSLELDEVWTGAEAQHLQ